MKNKTGKRIEFLTSVMNGLKSKDIYDVIDYHSKDESEIKTFMYPYLIKELTEYYGSEKKAKKNLLWEGNKQTTVNNMTFFGVQHRPDMVINGGLSIAVEIKKGDAGSAIREGIGQAMVYSTIYDFVLYLFIDISKDKKIKNTVTAENELKFAKDLWKNYNIIFEVI